MVKLIFILFFLIGIISCGLKYEPPITKEQTIRTRKQIIEQYIKNAYADSSVQYKSLFYGESIVVKPESYKVLDSLYEIKYQNELRGTFDNRLEEIIGNQRNVIIQDADKLRYIENHVYAVSTKTESEINFCDVEVNGKNEVTAFQITSQNIIPIEFLDLYQIYLSKESFLHPTYLASNEEGQFYNDYEEELNSLPFEKQNDFLIHELKIMYVAQKLNTLDKEKLIKELCISEILNRKYNSEIDKYVSIDGLFVDNILIHYLIVLNSDNKKYIVKYSPYLEFISYQITE